MSETLQQGMIALGALVGGAMIVVAVMKIVDFLGNFFVTTKKYQSDKEVEQEQAKVELEKRDASRSSCRKDIYEAIGKKADTVDVNLKFESLNNQIISLNNQQLRIIEGQSKLEGKLETLISLHSTNKGDRRD